MRAIWSWFHLAGLFVLVACAAPRQVASQPLRTSSGQYELEVRADGHRARDFDHDGQTYILGQPGERYVLRIHNHSAERIEAVVSVDGLDVMDGKSGAYSKRGYLVPAYSFVDVDGWRLSNHEVAAFRFAPIAASYAAQTGRARDVGVIGVAIFTERQVARVVPWPEARERSAPQRELQAELAPPAPEAANDAVGGSSSAPAAQSAAPGRSRLEGKRSQARSGLGTEFGEAVGSEVHEVSFTRANASKPARILGARYNDRDGLLALGIDVDGDASRDLALRQSATPFPTSERRFAAPPPGWRGH
jgi:hypothetical protein